MRPWGVVRNAARVTVPSRVTVPLARTLPRAGQRAGDEVDVAGGRGEGSGARLELLRGSGFADAFPLDDAETTIGRAATCGVCLDDDKVSRLHAVVQRTGTAGWRITDLDSTNGTFVNDQPVRADRPLRDRDRIRVGDSELVFRAPAHDETAAGRLTVVGEARTPPDVTRRERDVLVALCRPLFGRDPFPAPATTREICAELVVTESAVRHHLDRLYDKFAIYDADPDEKRRLLAADAIRRSAVTDQDVR